MQNKMRIILHPLWLVLADARGQKLTALGKGKLTDFADNFPWPQLVVIGERVAHPGIERRAGCVRCPTNATSAAG